MKNFVIAASWVMVTHPALGQVRASTLRNLVATPSEQPAAARRGTGPEYGYVRRVLDADTYDVLLPAGLVRVRLLGIDAPEVGQPFGHQAADSVMRLLWGRLLEVDRGAADLYGRTLTRLRVAKVASAGHKWLRVDSMAVARGWAWAYEPGRTTPSWALLQELAQIKYLGLWKCGSATPVRPAVWRTYTKKEKLACWDGCSW